MIMVLMFFLFTGEDVVGSCRETSCLVCFVSTLSLLLYFTFI